MATRDEPTAGLKIFGIGREPICETAHAILPGDMSCPYCGHNPADTHSTAYPEKGFGAICMKCHRMTIVHVNSAGFFLRKPRGLAELEELTRQLIRFLMQPDSN